MRKALFCIGTIIQFGYGIALLVTDFGSPADRLLSSLYWPFIAVALVTWFGYLFDATRNPVLDSNRKGLWVALLVFGNLFAELAYFVIHVVRTREPASEKAAG